MLRMILLMFALVCLVRAQVGEDELVNIKEFIPDIVLDLKYNTEDNFTGQKLYTTDEPLIARMVMERLILIQDSLKNIRYHNDTEYPEGLGLLVFDGYRPRAVSALMVEIYPAPGFVANPSQHNKGAAIDLSIVDLATGIPLEMPTPFDDFTSMASHNYMDLPAHIIANRELLKNMMQDIGGLVPYVAEWWHYSYPAGGNLPYLEFQLK